MSGYRPHEDKLTTAIDLIEDLRDAIQAQTQTMHVLIDTLKDMSARIAKVEEVLAPKVSDDNRLEKLLTSLVGVTRSNADSLHAIRAMLLRVA